MSLRIPWLPKKYSSNKKREMANTTVWKQIHKCAAAIKNMRMERQMVLWGYFHEFKANMKKDQYSQTTSCGTITVLKASSVGANTVKLPSSMSASRPVLLKARAISPAPSAPNDSPNGCRFRAGTQDVCVVHRERIMNNIVGCLIFTVWFSLPFDLTHFWL